MPSCHESRSSDMAQKLDQILESFVASQGEEAGRGKLLGAAFVVVNKDGMNIGNSFPSRPLWSSFKGGP